MGGSVFVRQFPRRLEIVSPGGFPPGITEENILWQQIPRNRRIAEVFAKCGLVERAGQGMNRMFEECIKETKPLPDFSGTDRYQVSVTLEGNIQDVRFLRFLEQVGSERLASFGTEDFLVLDLIRQQQHVPDNLVGRFPVLRKNDIIERVSHGRGTRYILSHRFYRFLGEPGVYTRTRGLDRETRKSLLLQHIEENREEGSSLSELMQIFPDLNRRQVQNLLHDLKAENRIHVVGRTKAARWYPGQGPEYVAPKPPGN
ncbi:MAG: ATP-binding protein [Chloroflexota bacterium]